MANQGWTSGIIWLDCTGDLLARSYWWISRPMEECHVAPPKGRVGGLIEEKHILAKVGVEPTTCHMQTICLTAYATE